MENVITKADIIVPVGIALGLFFVFLGMWKEKTKNKSLAGLPFVILGVCIVAFTGILLLFRVLT